MSLKTLLMPYVSRHLFARGTLLNKRQKSEATRRKQGRPHVVHYFHQLDDPYSALVVQLLPALMARYDVQWQFHLVGPPPDSAAPERSKLVDYSRTDAACLAAHHRLVFSNPGVQPSSPALQAHGVALLKAIQHGEFAQRAGHLCTALWALDKAAGVEAPTSTELQALQAHVEESARTRQQWGHYLGAMLYYEKEWYWGLDRLRHLEARLQDLGVAKPDVQGSLCPLEPDLTHPVQVGDVPDLHFYFSFRSPYSAIVAPRVFELARLTGARLHLKFVLPMVMRGLPVPAEKRQYIAHDTAREAYLRGTPFGYINDPVGKPAERGLSLMPLAIEQGKGEAYVLSFMQAVWAEGVNAGSNRGLRLIAERAGLDWAQAQQALTRTEWRQQAEAHRAEMFEQGLWGVPSFKVGEVSTWGQDRLWLVQQALGVTQAHLRD